MHCRLCLVPIWPALAVASVAFSGIGHADEVEEVGIPTCRTATIAQAEQALPLAWSEQLEALVAASGDPAMPWGCTAATIELVVHEEKADLHVLRESGTVVERRGLSLVELVPVGKALLARLDDQPVATSPKTNAGNALGTTASPNEPASTPLDVPSAPTAASPPADAPAEPTEDRPLDDEQPRGKLRLNAGPRYLGGPDLLTLGAAGRAVLPIGRVGVGLQASYDQLAAQLANTNTDPEYSEVFVGGLVGYTAVEEPVVLEGSIHAGMAVIQMLEEVATNPDRDVAASLVDFRLGAEVGVGVPLTDELRWSTSMDVGTAPAGWAAGRRGPDPRLPELPAFTLGLHTGLEVWIR